MARERGTRLCVYLVIVLLFAVMSPMAPWEMKCLLLLVISRLTAGGVISRTELAGLSAASSVGRVSALIIDQFGCCRSNQVTHPISMPIVAEIS